MLQSNDLVPSDIIYYYVDFTVYFDGLCGKLFINESNNLLLQQTLVYKFYIRRYNSKTPKYCFYHDLSLSVKKQIYPFISLMWCFDY